MIQYLGVSGVGSSAVFKPMKMHFWRCGARAEEEDLLRDFWDNFESEWPIYLGSQVSNYDNVLKKEYTRE